MAFHAGNRDVLEKLQTALEAFLNDHRKVAETDPEWIENTKVMTPEELEELSGCGCDDCMKAGELLGSIQ